MFRSITPDMQQRMAYLEALDSQDRLDGTPQIRRLRQIPPETGRFIAMLAASAPPGLLVEVGTSAGYSGMWLSLACRERGDRLVTFEIDEMKIQRAQETFQAAGVAGLIDIVHGDARQLLPAYSRIALCFLDAEKDIYRDIYTLVVPNLVGGGFLVADNAISHGSDIKDVIEEALQDPRLDAQVVPIGKGLLVCRKTNR